jgi:hypothetical protein
MKIGLIVSQRLLHAREDYLQETLHTCGSTVDFLLILWVERPFALIFGCSTYALLPGPLSRSLIYLQEGIYFYFYLFF